MATTHHPLDPLSAEEIEAAVAIVRETHQNVKFQIVSLHEPRKATMSKWLADRSHATKPPRVADVSVIAPGGNVGDGLVDLEKKQIVQWEWINGQQPIVSHIQMSYVLASKLTRSVLDYCGGAAKS